MFNYLCLIRISSTSVVRLVSERVDGALNERHVRKSVPAIMFEQFTQYSVNVASCSRAILHLAKWLEFSSGIVAKNQLAVIVRINT